MKHQMLTLQELSDLTGKSVRTLRRVVKESGKIKTDYQNTKLIASLQDVQKHYGITALNDYSEDSQIASHQETEQEHNIEEDSQIASHQANQAFIKVVFKNLCHFSRIY